MGITGQNDFSTSEGETERESAAKQQSEAEEEMRSPAVSARPPPVEAEKTNFGPWMQVRPRNQRKSRNFPHQQQIGDKNIKNNISSSNLSQRNRFYLLNGDAAARGVQQKLREDGVSSGSGFPGRSGVAGSALNTQAQPVVDGEADANNGQLGSHILGRAQGLRGNQIGPKDVVARGKPTVDESSGGVSHRTALFRAARGPQNTTGRRSAASRGVSGAEGRRLLGKSGDRSQGRRQQVPSAPQNSDYAQYIQGVTRVMQQGLLGDQTPSSGVSQSNTDSVVSSENGKDLGQECTAAPTLQTGDLQGMDQGVSARNSS